MLSLRDRDKVVRAVEDTRDEMVGFLQQLIRIDTVDPPGNNYRVFWGDRPAKRTCIDVAG